VTHDKAFLQAICEAPEDDTPRLVYADWLDDHGQPERAEFIRVQVELARTPKYDARWVELRLRERALWKANEQTWRKEVQAWAAQKVTFRRGFAAQLDCTATEFLRGGAGLFRRAPLEEARPRNVEDCFLKLIESPLLGRLTRLALQDLSLTTEIQWLADSPNVANLRALYFDLHHVVGSRAAKALAGSPHLERLRELTLNGWPSIGDQGFIALATSPHLAGLEKLWLNNNQIGAVGIQALLASPWKQMKTLRLPVNNIGPAEAEVLAQWLAGTQLEELDLNRNRGLRDGGARALASCPGLARLRVLRLIECALTDAGVQALASSPHLRELRFLNLADNPLTDASAEALAASPHLQHLRFLSLDRTDRISTYGIRLLARSEHLPSLQVLFVSRQGIEDSEWGQMWKGLQPSSAQKIVDGITHWRSDPEDLPEAMT
jgi:uncharacterized protein (TIGR02996 family)